MAIKSISRIQHRRGLKSDLPDELSEGEFGWCLDTRELYIGNSPGYGLNTPVLTQFSKNTELIQNKWQTLSTEIAAATVRPIGQKLNDFVSVKDFGAVGDGITDDAPAINAAITELLFSTGTVNYETRVMLYFPAGVYRISIPLLLYPYVGFIGDGKGKTIIQPVDNTLPYMLETADSMNNTSANIGGSAGILPMGITILDMTLDTNGNYMDIAHLNRYQSVRFENVEFKGGYQLGDIAVNTQKGVYLRSIGNVIDTYDAQIINCTFTNLTYAMYTDDPVSYTTISRTTFTTCYRALNFGENPNFFGPQYTTVSLSRFYNLDGAGILCFSRNPGITSLGNSFVNCVQSADTTPIIWNTTSTLNSSIGDVFSGAPPYILDNGLGNLVLNAQQNNLYGAGSTTFTNLPNAATLGPGARYFITDCNTNVFLSPAAGGGVFSVPVVSDGTNWLVG